MVEQDPASAETGGEYRAFGGGGRGSKTLC